MVSREIQELETRLAQLDIEVGTRTLERDMVARMLESQGRRPQRRGTAPKPARRVWLPIALAASLVALAGGVGTWKLVHRDDRVARAMAKFEDLTGQMCECHTKDCAQRVNDDLTRWGNEMAKDMPRDEKPAEEDMKKMADMAKRYGDCMTSAMR